MKISRQQKKISKKNTVKTTKNLKKNSVKKLKKKFWSEIAKTSISKIGLKSTNKRLKIRKSNSGRKNGKHFQVFFRQKSIFQFEIRNFFTNKVLELVKN